MTSAPSEVTVLLRRWHGGDADARDQLIPLVYDQLRRLAHRRLGRAGGHSLSTSELVHEAYLHLVDAGPIAQPDRAHFLALLTQVMRNLQEQYYGIVEVQVPELNAPTMALFRSLGFTEVDVGRVYRRDVRS